MDYLLDTFPTVATAAHKEHLVALYAADLERKHRETVEAPGPVAYTQYSVASQNLALAKSIVVVDRRVYQSDGSDGYASGTWGYVVTRDDITIRAGGYRSRMHADNRADKACLCGC